MARVADRAGVPDRATAIVTYCARQPLGFAARNLEELGYENVVSLAGGINDWKRHGYPLEVPQARSPRATDPVQPPLC
jgi:rhodanese-related sulfurtransferase